jgi:hypothetical protein
MSPSPNPSGTTHDAASVEVTTQSVIAAYIHEISERHRPTERAAEEPPVTSASD